MSNKFNKIIAFFTLFSMFFPIIASAADFDINNIISDEEARDYNSMTQKEIQDFLKSQNSFLQNYWYEGNNPDPGQVSNDPDEKFIEKRQASEIIYNAAQEAKINPKFLLTLLQKEQGLIENDNPTIRNLDYAMGYYCYDGQPCNPKFKGFGKQVRGTALQFEYYIENIYQYNYQPDKKSCVDDHTPYLPCTASATEVKPANKITAAMYVYTPHVHGNKLFSTLWNRYNFSGITGDNGVILTGILPDGALVKARDGEDGAVYLIEAGQKRAFASMTALVSRFDPQMVLNVESSELAKYEDGASIDHMNYSVLEVPSGDKYLIDGLTKRLITSDEAFRQLGFNSAEVEDVDEADLLAYQTGDPLVENSSSPFEQLIQDPETGGVYYVKDGKKSPIIDPAILELNYPDLKISQISQEALDKFTKIAPVKLENGSLIMRDNSPDVYVVYNGKRRLIPDGATFEKLGYNWTNIHTVSSKVMNFHSIGAPIAVN